MSKTITMDLEEYENILEIQKETNEAIKNKMVCRVLSPFGPKAVEWFDMGKELKRVQNLLDEANTRGIKDHELIYNLTEETMRAKAEPKQEENWREIINRETNYQEAISSLRRSISRIRNMTVKEFKVWKKRYEVINKEDISYD